MQYAVKIILYRTEINSPRDSPDWEGRERWSIKRIDGRNGVIIYNIKNIMYNVYVILYSFYIFILSRSNCDHTEIINIIF